MPGKIKTGQGTLIGNAGEYYVVAELLKRGIVAALAPRNTPAFDILATKDGKTVRIRVKTKSEEYDIWQWNVGQSGQIFRDLSDKDDYTVLVNLAQDDKDLAFHVIPTSALNAWLISDFDLWLRTPGKDGRPHSADNRKRHLEYKKYETRLAPFLGNWGILWE